MEAFDFPDPNLVAGRRTTSILATQALAYRQTLGRLPTAAKCEIALKHVAGEPGIKPESFAGLYQAPVRESRLPLFELILGCQSPGVPRPGRARLPPGRGHAACSYAT
jgi:hypothetical protein